MPSIIPRGFGFTHMQVYTNSIGMAEVDVTSFHCGPIYVGDDRFALVSVVKKLLFRAVPRNDFVVVNKKRVETSHGVFPRCYSFIDDLLGFAIPESVPDNLQNLVNDLKWFLEKDNGNAAAVATFANPCRFTHWFTIFLPTMIEVLRSGLFVVQLPRKPVIVGCIWAKPCEKRKGRSSQKRHEMMQFVRKKRMLIPRRYAFRLQASN